jgi:hypothetical protein
VRHESPRKLRRKFAAASDAPENRLPLPAQVVTAPARPDFLQPDPPAIGQDDGDQAAARPVRRMPDGLGVDGGSRGTGGTLVAAYACTTDDRSASMAGKRTTSKKPSAQVPNRSPSGKRKATPKPKGGGKKQGRGKG